MPRGNKAKKEIEEEPEDVMDIPDEEEVESESDDEVAEAETEVDVEGELEIEEDDLIEGDEEEDEEISSEEQAMTVAQQLLMKKKQAVLSQADVYRKYYTQKKTTSPYITKFEKAKLLSVRAQAIEKGATPFVPIDDVDEDPYSIAKREYEARRIPYFITRVLPNQEKEFWRLSDFKSLVPLTSM